MRYAGSRTGVNQRFLRGSLALGWITVLACGSGCHDGHRPSVAGGGRMTGWTPIRLPDTSRDAAFEAGLYAMRQWFPVAETSPEDGLIRSASVEYDQKGGTGRFRDAAIGYRNRIRRTATLVIRKQASGCVARCRVRVQRLDTEDHRTFNRNQRFADVPSETPIDRDAGISARQGQVWTDVPRDRDLERQILHLLRSRATGEDAG